VENPWLAIPAADYEGHMGIAGVDQLAPLAAIFAEIYAALRPPSVALLGCATGNGLEAIDPAITSRVVGVDLNPDYLAIARQRHARLGSALDLRCADLLSCDLGGETFALVHAALVFEHVEPAALAARIAGWVAPTGSCAVVLQLGQVVADERPAPAVSATPFASLQALSRSMRLLTPDELRLRFAPHGLVELRGSEVPLRGGKTLHVGLFGQAVSSS
jgi:SAM-dependent methyltransferase